MRRFLLVILVACACGQTGNVGVFEGAADIGVTPKKGSIEYDSSRGEYRVTGGGANIWGNVDAFFFAWKKIDGDVTITADVRFIGTGVVAHRKAVLMVRQDLTPDAAYADAALHGDGLTSLQFRTAKGEITQEVKSTASGPVRLRLERRGNRFVLSAGSPEGKLVSSEPVEVSLKGPVYAGIGVCSHDADVLETAVFSNVRVEQAPSRQ